VRSRGERAATAASTDRDGTADCTVAAERAAGHLHGTAAGGAPGAIRGDEGAAADRRCAGVSARKERDDAAFYLDAVEIGNRAGVGEGMLPAGIDRAGVRAAPAGDVALDCAAGDVERVVATTKVDRFAARVGDQVAGIVQRVVIGAGLNRRGRVAASLDRAVAFVIDRDSKAAGRAEDDNGRVSLAFDKAAVCYRSIGIDWFRRAAGVDSSQGNTATDGVGITRGDVAFDGAGISNRAAPSGDTFALKALSERITPVFVRLTRPSTSTPSPSPVTPLPVIVPWF
jgi:hypothetical protein